TREMLDPHAYDVGQWRAKRNCQEGTLQCVASVLNRTRRGLNNQFAALRGDRTGLGGVMGNHARLVHPLAIGKFHVDAQGEESRSQEPGVRSQESGVRSQESGCKGLWPGTN